MQKLYPINALQQGFEWFDEGLQCGLRARGWPALTRPESQIMVHVVLGVRRPSDIARRLGLTRQAVHLTLNRIVSKGIFHVVDDPDHGRIRRVVLTPIGKKMVADANAIVDQISNELASRIGQQRFESLMDALAADWGEPPSV